MNVLNVGIAGNGVYRFNLVHSFTWSSRFYISFSLDRKMTTKILNNPNPYIIALKKDNQSITLEPGGQLELSGAPLENIHQTCNEVNEHLKQVKIVGNELNVGFLGVGARLEGKLSSDLWMPKPR